MLPSSFPEHAAMTLRALTTTVLLAVLLAGCATTSKVMLSPMRPALAAEQVRVYFSPPSGRYVEIAMLETSSGAFTYGEQNKMNSVLTKLRVEAAKLGANGVLVQDTVNGYGGSSVGVGVGGGRFGGRSHVGGGVGVSISPTPKHARAIAIHVDNPPPADDMGAQPRN